MSDVTEAPPTGNGERRDDTSSNNSDYDVDGFEDAQVSTSSKGNLRKVHEGVQPCVEHAVSKIARRSSHENVERVQRGGEVGEQRKRKRRGGSQKRVDQPTEASDNQQLPQESRNAIPDMNQAGMPSSYHEPQNVPPQNSAIVPTIPREEGFANQSLVPEPGFNNTFRFSSTDIPAQSMNVDVQPILYSGIDNNRLISGTSYGFFPSPMGYEVSHGREQHPLPLPENQMIPEGTGFPGASHIFGHELTLNGNPNPIAGDIHPFLEESFPAEPDKFVANQFDPTIDGIPLDMSMIPSPPFLVEDLFQDDEELIEYLGA
ncbi:hypothetical protein J5N97_005432 [Dioscorea zingiberensis]|uniref:Uncharacterized protein n=1 Tax=Dioscorea zingiberensis TaxID=325984 RepID=A0A9D5HSP5_9LILI|nr:hypothetical protein J5N97_005432 [Dioscorea zingiberensis]